MSTKSCTRMEKIMTQENRKILVRINAYAENVLGHIDPQKVQVSTQLEKLKPIMQEIADEMNTTIEDIFILYMDIQSEATCLSQQKLTEELSDVNTENGNTFLIR